VRASADAHNTHANYQDVSGSEARRRRGGLGTEDSIDVLEESVPNDPRGGASTLLDAPTGVQIEDCPSAGRRTRADRSEVYILLTDGLSLSTERQGNRDFGTASCDAKRDVKKGPGQ